MDEKNNKAWFTWKKGVLIIVGIILLAFMAYYTFEIFSPGPETKKGRIAKLDKKDSQKKIAERDWLKKYEETKKEPVNVDWEKMKEGLLYEFKEDLLDVKSLDEKRLHAILRADCKPLQCVRLSEKFGKYIYENTDSTPIVHVYVGDKHYAEAKLSRSSKKYKGRYSIEEKW